MKCRRCHLEMELTEQEGFPSRWTCRTPGCPKGVNLRQKGAEKLDLTREHARAKLKKILALVGSAFAGEAQAAKRMAQKFREKHGL